MAIAYKNLKIGEPYRTKVSGDWQLVTLQDLREDLNQGKESRDVLVLVRTGAGNVIYRTPGQLRKP